MYREHILKSSRITDFRAEMLREEKSRATIGKYIHDVQVFRDFVGEGQAVDKELVIAYKQYLVEHYAVTSVNSMLAALNRFFKYMGWYDCVVKALRVQRESFRSRDRELSRNEYYRLLQEARRIGNDRLCLLMETMGATGIRVSELPFITVSAVETGRAKVSLKNKIRTVILPSALCCKLKQYIKKRKIRSGSIFITRTGKPMDRSNILHAMKALCEKAGVDRKKVFPHNLRHLFACVYYRAEKDLSHLADLLGHSNVNTTRIYTMVSDEEQARQIDGLKLVLT